MAPAESAAGRRGRRGFEQKPLFGLPLNPAQRHDVARSGHARGRRLNRPTLPPAAAWKVEQRECGRQPLQEPAGPG
jgi:hypothetical protein